MKKLAIIISMLMLAAIVSVPASAGLVSFYENKYTTIVPPESDGCGMLYVSLQTHCNLIG